MYLQYRRIVHVMDNFWRIGRQNVESTCWFIYLLFLQLTATCCLREELLSSSQKELKAVYSSRFTQIATHLSGHNFLLNSYIPIYMDQNLGRETWSCAISLLLFIIPCVFLCVLLFVCLFWGVGFCWLFFFFGKIMSTLSIHFFILLKLANEQFEKTALSCWY